MSRAGRAGLFALSLRAMAGVLAGVLVAGEAGAATLSGHVFVDLDDSGSYSAGDEPLAGITVWWEPTTFTVTDDTGAYVLDVSDGAPGVLWAQAPEGFSAAPSYASLASGFGDRTVDLALEPLAGGGDVFTFVVASDTHIGKVEYGLDRSLDAEDLAAALEQALAMEPAPAFFTITGDIAQVGSRDQVEQVLDVVGGLSVPFVPVAGNHDWKSPDTYRELFGPSNYSFDAAGVHFVVLNDNATPANGVWLPFFELDLARTDPERTVVVLIHRPPDDSDLAILANAGVDYMFTGHWHSNVVFDYDGLVQLNTEPFVRGGIDSSPAGYRVVAVMDGALFPVHHNTVAAPVVTMSYPRPGGCLSRAADQEVIAAVQASAYDPLVELRLDDGPWEIMVPAGGWTFTHAIELADDAVHELAVRVTAGGTSLEHRQEVSRCTDTVTVEPGAWPMLQGDPSRRGHSAVPVSPPLATVWARAVGGPLHGGQPVVAGGLVIVAVADFNDGKLGGVAAFDAVTGDEVWRYDTGAAVRNAPTVVGETVVAASIDGVVHAIDLVNGESSWQYDVAFGVARNESVLLQSPTVVDGVVYVGVLGRLVALDATSGELRWETEPMPQDFWLASNASPTVVGETLICAFGRGGLDGVPAFDTATGVERWRLPPGDCSPTGACAVGGHASGVVGDSHVYLSSGNGQVYAVEPLSGEVAWRTPLFEGSSNWDYAIVGTPALADGRLLVPTMYDRLHAVDATSGEALWSVVAGEGSLYTSHSRTTTGAFVASPVVTDRVVWAGGSDGVLRAIDLETGEESWGTDLGSPILMAPAPAGAMLFVGTFDGTLRAMAPVDPSSPDSDPGIPPDDDVEEPPVDDGCGCRATGASGDGATWLMWLVAVAIGLPWRRRPRRGRSSRSGAAAARAQAVEQSGRARA